MKQFLAVCSLLCALLSYPAIAKAQCSAPSGWTHSYFICALSPSTAIAGSTLTVKILGANLSGYATVKWGGSTLASSAVHHISQQEIDVSVIPSMIAIAGTYTVQVVEPGGLLTNILNFSATGGTTGGGSGPLTIVTTRMTAVPCMTTVATCYKLPDGQVGKAYFYQLQATGGVAYLPLTPRLEIAELKELERSIER